MMNGNICDAIIVTGTMAIRNFSGAYALAC
jgi:hypothetical protein